MNDYFGEIEKRIENQAVEEWKQNGGKVVGYTCSFMPPEILYAMGILPYRLRAIELESMDISDAYYGPFACSFPKCLLQVAGEGKYNFLDGVIITSACDTMRRLFDNWLAAEQDHEGIVPPFVHYFDMPYKTLPHCMDWCVDEIWKVIKAVEKHFDVEITDEKLKNAIKVYNEGRELLAELEQFRTGDDVFISGSDAYAVLLASTVIPRDVFNQQTRELLKNLKKEKKSILNGGRRIMVSGSICDDRDLIDLIEETDSIVVAENLCFGIRGAGDKVSLEGDPVKALAEKYINKSVCPRFLMDYKIRRSYLKEKAKLASVDGVIFENIRFCDMHGTENSLLERDFEQIGIPAIRLEREHGPLNETGRLRMRIEAFLEKI